MNENSFWFSCHKDENRRAWNVKSYYSEWHDPIILYLLGDKTPPNIIPTTTKKAWQTIKLLTSKKGEGKDLLSLRRNSPKNKETVILASLTRMSVVLYVLELCLSFGSLSTLFRMRPEVITWKRCPSDSYIWSATKGPLNITFTLLIWLEAPIRFFKRVTKTGATF